MTLPGPVPDPNDRIQQEFARIWQAIRERDRKTLFSAFITGGELTLSGDGALRQIDANGVERVFIGGLAGIPLGDGTPQPAIMLRDAAGKLRFAMYDPDPTGDGYQPVVWIYDHLDHVAFTTDKNGGVAEPWISVPMYPKAWPSTFLDAAGTDLTLPVSACNGSTVWEGRIGKVSHARIQYDFVGGRVTGVSGAPTYTFVVNGTTLDSFAVTPYGAQLRGPFSIANLIGQQNVVVQLKCSATGTATDRIACQMNGVWQRQSP